MKIETMCDNILNKHKNKVYYQVYYVYYIEDCYRVKYPIYIADTEELAIKIVQELTTFHKTWNKECTALKNFSDKYEIRYPSPESPNLTYPPKVKKGYDVLARQKQLLEIQNNNDRILEEFNKLSSRYEAQKDRSMHEFMIRLNFTNPDITLLDFYDLDDYEFGYNKINGKN